ncbi:SIR2 family protein [Marinobacter sp. ATCH36]|uniref:SIR2 family protein n=1 Tax=Marinobacter sp. ATCH36 TaxID=2945106 RepID=UPI0020213AA3|nr:SIR2 family protein [Marinobacter sp. ATCH36]MCL7943625.1 SIR2 family protein [Marinobacter sp. ATCH36]
MKANQLLAEGNELQHKVRTVSDLIRHIKTREADSETANYNLFFGAGCSATSGVRTAGALIEEWVFDLYERFNLHKPTSIEEAKQYFEDNHASWYNKDDAYSSLFEKTYEFPSQRRRFVEREVENSLPSIGYAYLTSLVSNRYFNTIFTSNFDDLINEAFYQFSNNRPLVCAHDSSIKTISITSKRPKIIKVHGDYLFDDIKSTLRETESLEQNTKEKLIEFCKEFGLIVVGYAGNDRSVMDVLDFLTKQENYLKNGVYWCLRKDDDINHSLHNLFWKEKVYPIIVDGFDELFAEIHTKLIPKGLDFESNLKDSKLQQIKKKILEDTSSVSKNPFIEEDIKAIKEASSKQEISDFLSNLNNSGESDGLSLTELRNLLEIEDLLKKDEYDKAYKLAEDFYYQATESRDKSRYISMLISISDNKGDSRNCIAWCDRLVELDPNNTSYIIKKSQHLNDLSTRYFYLYDKLKKYDYKFKLHNAVARSGFELIRNNPLSTELSEETLIEILDNSLKLNPSLSNPAWFIKFEVLVKMKKNLRSEKASDDRYNNIKKSIAAHTASAKIINSKSLVSLKLELRTARDSDDENIILQIIDRLYELYEESDTANKVSINECLNEAFANYKEIIKSPTKDSLFSDFYEKHLQDKEIRDNAELLISKGMHFISRGDQKSKSESYFISALECSNIVTNIREAIALNNCHEFRYSDKISRIIEKNRSKMFDTHYFDYKYEIASSNGDFSHAMEYLEKAYDSGLSMERYYSNLSYLLVLSSDYKKLLDIGETHKEKITFCDNETFTINYQYAAKMLKSEKYKPVILRNIVANTKEQTVILAAFAVLGQENDLKRILSEQIQLDFANYYTFKRWPIIPSALLDSVAATKAA